MPVLLDVPVASPRPAGRCHSVKLVPGRGAALQTAEAVARGLAGTRLPFDVSRAYDEATRFRDPRIWTAERDRQMWSDLEP